MAEMNSHMIDAWNSVVKAGDLVYHLGDFGMGPWVEWAGFRKQLNGAIHLIQGNHDRKLESWLLPQDRAVNWVYSDSIYMTHAPPFLDEHAVERYHTIKRYPVPEGAKLVLCGHVHGSWARRDYEGIPVVNVGVDVRGYVPLTLEQILLQEGLANILE